MAITRIGNPAIADVRGVNFRNIIINGDMSIAQRATSATGLGNGDSGYHTVDRFKFVENNSPTCEFTQTQSTDVPTGQGFSKSLKMDCTTAQGSLAGDDFIYINTSAEGQNLQYLKKGTSSAESVTLSFWVKSNKTGTYIFEIIDRDNSRAISKSYTISSADTWEKKTITYPGDTTGALDNDNARSFELIYWLAAGANFQSGTLQTSWGSRTTTNDAVGQVNLADSTSNEWYITGVQLEAGTTASDFEFLPVDVNLERCKRYLFITDARYYLNIGMGGYYASAYVTCGVTFPTTMRSAPSLEQTTGTEYYRLYVNNGSDNFDSFAAGIQQATTNSAGIDSNSGVSGTSGQTGRFVTYNSSSKISFDAEL
jgi:hypothetical protein